MIGAFGKVYKGEMKMKDPNGASVNKDIAVKTLKGINHIVYLICFFKQ